MIVRFPQTAFCPADNFIGRVTGGIIDAVQKISAGKGFQCPAGDFSPVVFIYPAMTVINSVMGVTEPHGGYVVSLFKKSSCFVRRNSFFFEPLIPWFVENIKHTVQTIFQIGEQSDDWGKWQILIVRFYVLRFQFIMTTFPVIIKKEPYIRFLK